MRFLCSLTGGYKEEEGKTDIVKGRSLHLTNFIRWVDKSFLKNIVQSAIMLINYVLRRIT